MDFATILNELNRASKNMYISVRASNQIMEALKPHVMSEFGASFVLTSITQQMIKDPLCLYMYQNNIRVHVRSLTYFSIIKVLLNYPDVKNPLRAQIFNEVENIYDDPASNYTVRSEAADVMHAYWPARAERLLQNLGEDDCAPPPRPDQTDMPQFFTPPPPPPRPDRTFTPPPPRVPVYKAPFKTVYTDSQNVHNNTIGNSVITAIKQLIKLFPPVIKVNNTIIDVYHDDTLTDLLNRIATTFGTAPEYLVLNPPINDMSDLPEAVELHDKLFHSKGGKMLKYGSIQYKDMLDVYIAFNEVLLLSNAPLDLCKVCDIPDAEALWNDRGNTVGTVLRNLAKTKSATIIRSDRVKYILRELYPFQETQEMLAERINESHIRDIRLAHILISVWSFIQRHEHKEELIKRLKEELDEGKKVCSSGICARMISAIQGFFDTDKHPLLRIKMSVDDELTGKIYAIVNKACVDAQIDPAFDDTFPKLLKDTLDTNSEAIISGYGDMITLSELQDFAKKLYHITIVENEPPKDE